MLETCLEMDLKHFFEAIESTLKYPSFMKRHLLSQFHLGTLYNLSASKSI